MDCAAGSPISPVVSSHHVDKVIVAREPPVNIIVDLAEKIGRLFPAHCIQQRNAVDLYWGFYQNQDDFVAIIIAWSDYNYIIYLRNSFYHQVGDLVYGSYVGIMSAACVSIKQIIS